VLLYRVVHDGPTEAPRRGVKLSVHQKNWKHSSLNNIGQGTGLQF